MTTGTAEKTDHITDTVTKAVIYARVSSAAQVEEGHGLESQTTRCREFANARGYEVVETFFDKAVSGGLAERPGVVALLAHLKRSCQHEEQVVIIDDISRLARDIRVHADLRFAIQLAGGRLESPSITFGEDSDSVLVENLLASVSQHQRQKNGEQTKNRMRARAMNGYWVFHAPIGLRYDKVAGHGKLLVRDEPLASIIAEALNGFASGRFETQAEVKRYLESQPAFPKDRNGTVRFEEVVRLLRRPHYAGYIEVPDWGVSLRKGHHEGIVTFETWNRVQERMSEAARAPARKDISADFPLRGFITCGDCCNPLTANWSKSKTGKKHPYYMCFTKGCESYRKSIRRDVLEGEFADLVRSMEPRGDMIALFKALFRKAWDDRAGQAKAMQAALKRDLAKVEKGIEQLLDRLVEASSPSVISAYESRVAKLEREKLVLAEKLTEKAKPVRPFDELFELACTFLANPCKLWEKGPLAFKRTVLRLAFTERMAYCRKSGLRTPKTTLPFKLLGDINMGKGEMAERMGFEPTNGVTRYSLSRGAPSATRPPLHKWGYVACHVKASDFMQGNRGIALEI